MEYEIVKIQKECADWITISVPGLYTLINRQAVANFLHILQFYFLLSHFQHNMYTF